MSTIETLIYKCAGASCPGLPYRASDIGHPAACARPISSDPPDPALSAVTAARVAANRAEDFARTLRRLVEDLEHVAQRPSDSRAVGILAASRAEAVGAGERLAAADAVDEEQTERAEHQVRLIRASRRGAPLLRDWATQWDAFALRVDP